VWNPEVTFLPLTVTVTGDLSGWSILRRTCPPLTSSGLGLDTDSIVSCRVIGWAVAGVEPATSAGTATRATIVERTTRFATRNSARSGHRFAPKPGQLPV
jgi:hypothetical protein